MSATECHPPQCLSPAAERTVGNLSGWRDGRAVQPEPRFSPLQPVCDLNAGIQIMGPPRFPVCVGPAPPSATASKCRNLFIESDPHAVYNPPEATCGRTKAAGPEDARPGKLTLSPRGNNRGRPRSFQSCPGDQPGGAFPKSR